MVSAFWLRGQRSIPRGPHAFARADGNRQPILSWRVRAVVRRVVVAERVIGAVEVQIVNARRGALEVEVPPARVGFRPVRQVTERHEQVAQVLLADFDERVTSAVVL